MQVQKHKQAFVQEIWRWYQRNKRSLPWRDLTIENAEERAYRILVSEVMLQQTQVPRVTIMYPRFLKQFPTMRDLAKATDGEIIRAWQGLGYNMRALRLRNTAKTIVEKFHGTFPKDREVLQSIPGIGPYTAAAIRNFAFNLPTPCLDTNIRRILHRTFVGPENPDGTWKKDDQYLLHLAKETLDIALSSIPAYQYTNMQRAAAEWHNALMDFGSIICTKKNPRWDQCPLTKKGFMKATCRNLHHPSPNPNPNPRREPGRFERGRFIPNRIFRGRIVEQLRINRHGMTVVELGKVVKKDWRSTDQKWFAQILKKLAQDTLIQKKMRKYLLPL